MRAILAILLVSPTLVGMSCGSDQDAAEMPAASTSASETTISKSPATRSYTTRSWWVIDDPVSEIDPGTEPLVEALRVYSQPRREQDAFPRSGEPPQEVTTGQKFDWGNQLFGESRLLISDLGKDRLKLFGVRTDRGWVCTYLITPNGELVSGGGCDRGLHGGVTYALTGDDDHWRVHGLASDDVRNVFVASGKTRFPATIGRNAFYFEALLDKFCPVDAEELQIVTPKATGHAQLSFDESRSEFGCR